MVAFLGPLVQADGCSIIVLPAQLYSLFCRGLLKAVHMRRFIVRNEAVEIKKDSAQGEASRERFVAGVVATVLQRDVQTSRTACSVESPTVCCVPIRSST